MSALCRVQVKNWMEMIKPPDEYNSVIEWKEISISDGFARDGLNTSSLSSFFYPPSTFEIWNYTSNDKAMLINTYPWTFRQSSSVIIVEIKVNENDKWSCLRQANVNLAHWKDINSIESVGKKREKGRFNWWYSGEYL